jgi:hypothetical protein
MKHLKKFNESKYDDIQQDIEYAIGFIIDKLGDPNIKRERWGENMKFTYTWGLGINISHLNKAEDLINKIKDIMEEMDDLIAAKDRLPDYDIYMSIDTRIIIVFIPKENTSSEGYKFIIGQNRREIQLKKTEIERFFRTKGCTIIDTRSIETDDTSSVEFTIDKQDSTSIEDFKTLFLDELRDNENIDTELYIDTGNSTFEIYPDSEKRYITLG